MSNTQKELNRPCIYCKNIIQAATAMSAYSDEVDHTFRRKWITDSDASGSLIPNDVDHSERSDAYFNFTTTPPFCVIF